MRVDFGGRCVGRRQSRQLLGKRHYSRPPLHQPSGQATIHTDNLQPDAQESSSLDDNTTPKNINHPIISRAMVLLGLFQVRAKPTTSRSRTSTAMMTESGLRR